MTGISDRFLPLRSSAPFTRRAGRNFRATFEQAFRVMQENSVTNVGVTNDNGKLVGLVTSETIKEMKALMVFCQTISALGKR